MRIVPAAAVWFANGLALFGLYMLFVAKWSWEEAIAGAAVAASGATAASAVFWASGARYWPRLSWLKPLLAVPPRVLADCGVVGLAIWRQISGRPVAGRFRIVPFDPGEDDAASAARRALVTASVSISPNTYVVAIDRERRLLLVHQLVPSPEPPGRGDQVWPL